MDDENVRKSKRLGSKPRTKWTADGKEEASNGGACGTSEDCAHFIVQKQPPKVIKKRKQSTDFERFNADIRSRLDPKNPHKTQQKRDVLTQREYDTSNKIVVASQPLQDLSSSDDKPDPTTIEETAVSPTQPACRR